MDVLGDRASFLLPDTLVHRSDAPGYLVIHAVSTDDAGDYKCRVDFSKSPTRTQKIRLNVIEPPRYVSILDDAGKEIGDLITYKEGDRLELTCQTDNGNPLPKITWWKGTALVSTSYEINPDRLVKSVLIVSALHREDLHATLTCQASNNNFSLPASRTVTLDLTLRPLTVQVVPLEKGASVSRPYEVKCVTYGSRPPPSITWWKDGNRIRTVSATIVPSPGGPAKQNEYQVEDYPNREPTTVPPSSFEVVSDDRNQTTSVLRFVPLDTDHGKILTCRVENKAIFGSILEDSMKLDVHYPPTAVLELGSSLKESNLKEGDDVYFECRIRANPRVLVVEWKFQGEPLYQNRSLGILTSNQSLVLQKIRRQQMGAFTCIAHNSEGQGESNDVVLTLKHVPYCQPNPKLTYGVAIHETVEIIFNVAANPMQVHFRWALNSTGNLLEETWSSPAGSSTPRSRITSVNTRSVLHYTPGSDQDYGVILCWGSNVIGEQREPCVYRIMPARPPDPLFNCSIVNLTETDMFVECVEGFDGGMEQHFVIEVYDADTHHLEHNATSRAASFYVDGLKPGRGLLVSLYSVNARGRSGALSLAANTLRVAERRTDVPAMINVTPILGVLIGVVAALVFAAVVIVIVMKLRDPDDDPDDEKKKIQTEKTQMSTLVLKKNLVDTQLLDEKNPDIIPGDEDQGFVDSPAHSRSALTEMSTPTPTSDRPFVNGTPIDNRKSGRNQPEIEDVQYAELQLVMPNNRHSAVSKQFSPTQTSPPKFVYHYANHHARQPSPCSSPLAPSKSLERRVPNVGTPETPVYAQIDRTKTMAAAAIVNSVKATSPSGTSGISSSSTLGSSNNIPLGNGGLYQGSSGKPERTIGYQNHPYQTNPVSPSSHYTTCLYQQTHPLQSPTGLHHKSSHEMDDDDNSVTAETPLMGREQRESVV